MSIILSLFFKKKSRLKIIEDIRICREKDFSTWNNALVNVSPACFKGQIRGFSGIGDIFLYKDGEGKMILSFPINRHFVEVERNI